MILISSVIVIIAVIIYVAVIIIDFSVVEIFLGQISYDGFGQTKENNWRRRG